MDTVNFALACHLESFTGPAEPRLPRRARSSRPRQSRKVPPSDTSLRFPLSTTAAATYAPPEASNLNRLSGEDPGSVDVNFCVQSRRHRVQARESTAEWVRVTQPVDSENRLERPISQNVKRGSENAYETTRLRSLMRSNVDTVRHATRKTRRTMRGRRALMSPRTCQKQQQQSRRDRLTGDEMATMLPATKRRSANTAADIASTRRRVSAPRGGALSARRASRVAATPPGENCDPRVFPLSNSSTAPSTFLSAEMPDVVAGTPIVAQPGAAIPLVSVAVVGARIRDVANSEERNLNYNVPQIHLPTFSPERASGRARTGSPSATQLGDARRGIASATCRSGCPIRAGDSLDAALAELQRRAQRDVQRRPTCSSRRVASGRRNCPSIGSAPSSFSLPTYVETMSARSHPCLFNVINSAEQMPQLRHRSLDAHHRRGRAVRAVASARRAHSSAAIVFESRGCSRVKFSQRTNEAALENSVTAMNSCVTGMNSCGSPRHNRRNSSPLLEFENRRIRAAGGDASIDVNNATSRARSRGSNSGRRPTQLNYFLDVLDFYFGLSLQSLDAALRRGSGFPHATSVPISADAPEAQTTFQSQSLPTDCEHIPTVPFRSSPVQSQSPVRRAPVQSSGPVPVPQLNVRTGPNTQETARRTSPACLLPWVRFDSRKNSTLSIMSLRCTVCQEDFQHGDWQSWLPCMHTFHKRCIRRWLKRSRNCPICQVNVETLLSRTIQSASCSKSKRNALQGLPSGDELQTEEAPHKTT